MMSRYLLFFFSLCPFLAFAQSNGICYVRKNATGNGSSWNNALGELADALVQAKQNPAIREIWVAKGFYKPIYSPADNKFGIDDGRRNSFLLVKDVKLYGGFAGTELTLAERDPGLSANATVLTGDVNGDDNLSGMGSSLTINNISDNNYQLVVGSGDLGSAEFNGFTIGQGNANSLMTIIVNDVGIPGNFGGGIALVQTSPKISNIKFLHNSASHGGGAYLESSSPQLDKLSFQENMAVQGGALYGTMLSNPKISNSHFFGNIADEGGAIYNEASSPMFINSIFSRNTARQHGGAMFFMSQTQSVITNSTFSRNQATNWGQAIYAFDAELTLNNSIIFAQPGFTGNNNLQDNYSKFNLNNCILQYPGTGFNIVGTYQNVDPLFIIPEADGLSLQPSSPALEAGDNNLYVTAGGNLGTDKDLAGQQRLVGTKIDIGAYEHQTPPVLPVSFGGFTAKTQHSGVRLEWNTHSETDNQHFNIYHSSNGRDFSLVWKEDSKGSGPNNYSSVHTGPTSGTNYYRLSQTDRDGTEKILAEQAVNYQLGTMAPRAWPNPTRGRLTIEVDNKRHQRLQLIDLSGKIHLKRGVRLQNEIQLDLSGLQSGIYILKLLGNETTEVIKIIKE